MRALLAGPGRPALVLAGVLSVGAVLAACGSSGSNSSAGTTTTTNANQARFAAYTACLKAHGVANPQSFGGFGGLRGGQGNRPPGQDPQAGPNGQSPEGQAQGGQAQGGQAQGGSTPSTPRTTLAPAERAKLQAARQACQDKLPAGGANPGGQAFQAYLSCLRDHGVPVPTTAAAGASQGAAGPGGPGGRPAIDRNNPAFATANQVCAPLLPNRGPGVTTTTVP
jgi:hypothetical protein